MKDYVFEFQNKITEIDKEIKHFYIMNAGSMNHGKSSLFNSLLDSNVFATEDVRTTVENQTVKWKDNIYLVDTPGIAADESDDLVAYEAYRCANMIIFVHTAKVGELHKKELETINNIKSFFTDQSFFWQHFCLVITFIDSDSNDSVLAILNKSLEDIKTNCGGYGFKTFIVSNSRYQKGLAENKQGLINKSGIPELRNYLQSNFSEWLSENNIIRKEKIRRAKAELLSQIEIEISTIKQSSAKKRENLKKWQQNFLYKVELAVNQYNSDEQELRYKDSRLYDMKNDLKRLKNQWEREHY